MRRPTSRTSSPRRYTTELELKFASATAFEPVARAPCRLPRIALSEGVRQGLYESAGFSRAVTRNNEQNMFTKRQLNSPVCWPESGTGGPADAGGSGAWSAIGRDLALPDPTPARTAASSSPGARDGDCPSPHARAQAEPEMIVQIDPELALRIVRERGPHAWHRERERLLLPALLR